MKRYCRAHSRRARIICRLAVIGVASLLSTSGCADFLNPSFLQLFPNLEGGEAGLQSVEAPIGHIPILFDNDARMADNVFQYVVQADSVVRPDVVDEILIYNPQLTRAEVEAILQAVIDGAPVDLEEVNLPPRVRLTINVTNVDGGVQQLEFLDGLTLARDESQGGDDAGQLPQDLTENTNSRFIVQCEIARIDVVRIDVFIPVSVRITTLVEDDDGSGTREVCLNTYPLSLQFDDLNEDVGFESGQDEFDILRNYDPRFFPPALTSVQCGTVITVQLTGELSLPFRDVPSECQPVVNPPADNQVPGFLDTDDVSELQIPGRYGLTVTIRG